MTYSATGPQIAPLCGGFRRVAPGADRREAVRDGKFHLKSGKVDHCQQRLILGNGVFVFDQQVTDNPGHWALDLQLLHLSFNLGQAVFLLFDVKFGGLQLESQVFCLELCVLFCVAETQLRKRDVVVGLVEVEFADGFLRVGCNGASLLPLRRDKSYFRQIGICSFCSRILRAWMRWRFKAVLADLSAARSGSSRFNSSGLSIEAIGSPSCTASPA